jgi:hypothetical protein
MKEDHPTLTCADDKPVQFLSAFAFHACLVSFTLLIPAAVFYLLLLLLLK